MTYADTPEKWDRVARVLRDRTALGVPGLDCEFDGCDITKESPAARSRLVCWSVAVMTERVSAAGNFEADGIMLPREAAFHPPIREWLEDPKWPKAAHNAPAELHTFWNAGVELAGVINTITLVRWMRPGWFEYNLDVCGLELLGKGKTSDIEVFLTPTVVDVPRRKKVTRCECGEVPCRKRKDAAGHARFEESVETFESVVKMLPTDLSKILPGHPQWEDWNKYVIRDAVIASELHKALAADTVADPHPWYWKPSVFDE